MRILLCCLELGQSFFLVDTLYTTSYYYGTGAQRFLYMVALFGQVAIHISHDVLITELHLLSSFTEASFEHVAQNSKDTLS